jgi:hypothetical protein
MYGHDGATSFPFRNLTEGVPKCYFLITRLSDPVLYSAKVEAVPRGLGLSDAIGGVSD